MIVATRFIETLSLEVNMAKVIKFLMWTGRTVIELADIIVRAKRTLDEMMNASPWRRPWSGQWQRQAV